MIKKIILWLVVIVIVVWAVLYWYESRTLDGPVQKVTSTPQEIERGRYLALASDCAACHTSANGAPLAGGFPLDTPFGTIYSSNLTPSADFGIGRWTKDEFYKALTQGISPPSKHLYPAMPYTSYKGMTREDSDAIYSYLMSRPAVDVAPPENSLPFPLNQRMAMIGWNLLFFNDKPLPDSSQGSSPEWQRGKYLVNVLEHCSECHTPRGALGEMELDNFMKGGALGRFIAPDITPEALAARGWTKQDLQQFFMTGIAPQGSAYSDMHPVIYLSSQHLTPEDNSAIATYLMGDNPPATLPLKMGEGNSQGRQVYLETCSGCHSYDGSGKPNVAVAMKGNSTLRDVDSTNLINTILDGLPEQPFPNNQSLQSMPGFANKLNDQQISELVNFLRVEWGGQPADITPEHVKALRQ